MSGIGFERFTLELEPDAVASKIDGFDAERPQLVRLRCQVRTGSGEVAESTRLMFFDELFIAPLFDHVWRDIGIELKRHIKRMEVTK